MVEVVICYMLKVDFLQYLYKFQNKTMKNNIMTGAIAIKINFKKNILIPYRGS